MKTSQAGRQPIVSELSRRSKLELLCRHLPRPSRILEVGAGSGWFSSRLRSRGHSVTTFDIDGPADVRGDILKWPMLGLRPSSFDAVVALELIEHVDCLDALRDLCRPGGVIFLSSPHPRWDWAMKALEAIGLTQRRTSPHVNLTDFSRLPLEPLVMKRPLLIHQVAIFLNTPRETASQAQAEAA